MAQPRSKQQSTQDDEYGLEQRQYRDKQGRIHHHTREYMERQGETSQPDERQERRRSGTVSRKRRSASTNQGSSLGNLLRSIATGPVFLLAAAATGTFLMARRTSDNGWPRRSFERDDDNENFPGTGWLRDTILPSPETPRDVFITGLRNAHSVEVKATQLLERQIEALSDYPDVRARLQQHLDETRKQLDRLEDILRQLDQSPSSIK